MILFLRNKYSFSIAYFFLVIFTISFQIQLFAGSGTRRSSSPVIIPTLRKHSPKAVTAKPFIPPQGAGAYIGGPSQPEMSSFKSVGTDNMVNLFTGDFSYNIPLLDVGGYPVNIYYSGNITMEQEASWVGLGWNINPGNINRNMRGVPDDFDGTDMLKEEQAMKPNETWGVKSSSSLEIMGIETGLSLNANASMGFSYNNYLGPAIDLGIGAGVGVALASKTAAEKNANSPKLALNAGADLSSRQGLSLSAQTSLSAQQFQNSESTSYGLSLGTSFNSRTGIKDLQISGQTSFNKTDATNKFDFNETLQGTSITFARPTYIPTLRSPLVVKSVSADFKNGSGNQGVTPSWYSIQGYYQLSQFAKTHQEKPLVGYMYYQNALNNADAVMDFTRLGDREVTPKTPIVSAPEYAYDVFSIQGEGTGGSIRAYRTDLGYVRDNVTTSKSDDGGVGLEVSPPSHYGANVNLVKTPTTVGEWGSGNKLKDAMHFEQGVDVHKTVYFRNPGESSVIENDQFNRIGGLDLVRFKLSGASYSPNIEPVLEHCNTDGTPMLVNNAPVLTNVSATSPGQTLLKRTQVITFLTADEAARVGLDKTINSYNNINFVKSDGAGHFVLDYQSFSRIDDKRKGHHLSQINVTESNGKRYVYGLPVYNITQKDFTFSVANISSSKYPDDDKVIVAENNWMNTSNNLLVASSSKVDGYVQETTTPAYAHSFLLTGLLSPDYVDVTGNGITEDDLGDAVKFNYHRVTNTDNSIAYHNWRTPLSTSNEANFNAGHRTENKDDKGIIAYGERESWYLQSIESKTMIALFFLGNNRHDGKGARDTFGGINTADQSTQYLDHISLYNKADLYANGLIGNTAAKPVKTVHFVYSYQLCKGTPDNIVPDAALGNGKLTLEKIYFTFNGQERSKNNQPNFHTINQYVFGYSRSNSTGDNPSYEMNAFDRWGTYKSPGKNGNNLSNKVYPYSLQPGISAATSDDINTNAGAWALKSIVLPSGGQIDITYESDDYAFVQNKRAANMMNVAGFGYSNDISKQSANLYETNPFEIRDNDYVFVNVPDACQNAHEVYAKYLDGLSQLAFRLSVHVNDVYDKSEYLTVYADLAPGGDDVAYGVVPTQDKKTIWIKLAKVDAYSPLSLTALEYVREQLPGKAYPGYDVSESGTVVDQLAGMVSGLFSNIGQFLEPLKTMRFKQHLAQVTDPAKCFVRLNNPLGVKYGGGSRVKKILLRDNWNAMTGQFGSTYGQEYDYTTKEVFDGEERTISSGVASYEPGIGGEENPFQSIVSVKNKLPLGPASHGAIEMPILDAFFPAANVGYSEVTVRSHADVQASDKKQKIRSGIGKQVTQFYTAKDFPVQYSLTSLDPATDIQEHDDPATDFFYQSSFDSRAVSQGFLVITNDMHGKMKAQSSYAANDENTMINHTENFYSNTGANGMNDKYDFITPTSLNANGNVIKAGNMGIDAELMVDTREFSVETHSLAVQAQTEMIAAVTIPVPWITAGESENIYRAVTCTKVVNYHSAVDHVIVIDKGSKVTTQNLLYDNETGNVVVNEVNNEFEKPVYTTTYPAYWAYSGMGLAYKNIDAVFTGINFYNGEIVNPGFDKGIFESGDELIILSTSAFQGCEASIESPGISVLTDYRITTKGDDIIWAFDPNKTNNSDGVTSSALTNTDANRKIIFLDSIGKPYSKSGVSFRIIRSGKRNILDAQVQGITSMASPIITSGNSRSLFIGPATNVINATATEYKEKWQTDQDEIKTKKLVDNPLDKCNPTEVDAICNEPSSTITYLEKSINPYNKGLVGNFSPYRSVVFYNNRAENSTTNWQTNLPVNGYLDNFTPYWSFSSGGNLKPSYLRDGDHPTSNWVWNSRTTRKNAKGQELENVNALNIYTAAQYGYSKTLPVAITNNARYSETAFESFEDDGYENSVNGSITNLLDCKKHINFSNFDGFHIVSSDDLGFAAHSGKKMLSVSKSQTVTKNFNVSDNNTNVNDFSLGFGSYQNQNLNEPGGIVTYSSSPAFVPNEDPLNSFSFSPAEVDNGGFDLAAGGVVGAHGEMTINNISTSQGGQTNIQHNFNLSINYYFEVTQSGNTSFYLHGHNELSGDATYDNWYYTLYIYDALKNTLIKKLNGENIHEIDDQAHTYLCKGKYKISFQCQNNFKQLTSGNATESYFLYLTVASEGTLTRDYKTLSSSADCPAQTTPIVGDNAMLNPVFTVPANKKMLLSAWVRQDKPADNTPYPPVAYKNNELHIQFKGADNSTIINQQQLDANGQQAKDNSNADLPTAQDVSFVPTGPVIDGWQQYTAYFQVPGGAKSMALSFKNNSSAGNVYFDDIRMLPFNANMKSYVYDPVNQRLVAELDANNYATFYEYDEEGKLIRTKAETKEGIKTITETRSAKQKNILTIQQ